MSIRVHVSEPHDWGLQGELGDTLARHLAMADLLGRLQILRHAHKSTGKMLPIAETPSVARFAEDDHHHDDGADLTAAFSFDLPNEQAAHFIRELTPVTRAAFDGLTAQYRRDAYTLAGVSDVRLIEKIRDALAEIAAKGETVRDFERAVDELTSAAEVQQLNSFSLDTAFQTAMQKAYSAGRLQQMNQPHVQAALPFWQYWTVGDDRVRPEHACIHGFVARAIDPVWRKIYPPSGFNCRCSVAPLTEKEAIQEDPKAAEGGLERLPKLAMELVPTPGFNVLMAA